MLTTLRRKIFGDLKMHRGRFLAVWVVVAMGALELFVGRWGAWLDLRHGGPIEGHVGG